MKTLQLADERAATEPVESAGGRRDDVRLLVSWRSSTELVHTTVAHLPAFLDEGDLIVVNASATLAAAVATGDGKLVHFSTQLPGGLWLVELRHREGPGSRPLLDGRPGVVPLVGDGTVQLLAPFPAGDAGPAPPAGARLWVAVPHLPGGLLPYLARWGQPIRYGYAGRAFPLADYQTIFADEPGSAEMPSAGRPFTAELVAALARRGVGVAPLVLHTGVSSAEAGEAPYPERYRVPRATAERVNAAHDGGHRVVAVGTTVTRALETATDDRGRVHPAQGWTELVITPERGVRAVDGLFTGWHPPAASHLMLVEAVGGRPTVERSYRAAVAAGYRWHEFGDAHLVLP